jgi:hypothetical protein
VYSDGRIRWTDGDRALRAMLGVSYVGSHDRQIGLLVLGQKLQPRFAHPDLSKLRPTETTATIDLAGNAAFPVPGQPAFLLTAGEAALVLGRTDIAPEVLHSWQARVQRFGILARLGLVVTTGVGPRRWGKWGTMLEWGYSSGDADPGDGVDHRFAANPSRRVGLILFDEVLRWKTARAATTLDEPRVGMRPNPSSGSFSSAGGVSGVNYLSLSGLYRPLPNVDLRAAALAAQASTDVVDPARLLTSGRWTNLDGGTPTHRDLGVEFDMGMEYWQPLANGLSLSLGAEGGLLFPGRALADASERSIGKQALVRGRFGFYF